MTAAASPAPGHDGRRPHCAPDAPDGRPVLPDTRTALPGHPALPAAYPTPGTTLTILCDYDGDLWSSPLSRVDPAVAVDGLPLPVWGPGAARSYGTVELHDPRDRARWCTDVVVGASRCMRLIWGQPGGTPASHVPAWTLLHADGTVTVVDVLTTAALTSGADLLPMAETAALVKARGWRWELLTGTDPSLDPQTIREIVLDAPRDVISEGLYGAAVFGAGLPELVDQIRTPSEVLWLRPYLHACWAAEAARRHAEPPHLFRP